MSATSWVVEKPDRQLLHKWSNSWHIETENSSCRKSIIDKRSWQIKTLAQVELVSCAEQKNSIEFAPEKLFQDMQRDCAELWKYGGHKVARVYGGFHLDCISFGQKKSWGRQMVRWFSIDQLFTEDVRTKCRLQRLDTKRTKTSQLCKESS